VVAVDPGHGGKETGAVGANGLTEKDVNLRIALKLAALLGKEGYTPVLTRDSDRAVNAAGEDLNADGKVDNDDDLQARVDIANAAHADILVSIHNNGSTSRSTRGTTVYYCDTRPFARESIRLASALQRSLVAEMQVAGYEPVDNGTGDDAPLRKPFGHLFLLGPRTPRVASASNMPGALGESLYLTNPTEASLLAEDTFLSALAQGYFKGIEGYFNE
jgi:N-acetylmuramoyl-L-alanine amidase